MLALYCLWTVASCKNQCTLCVHVLNIDTSFWQLDFGLKKKTMKETKEKHVKTMTI